MRLKDVDRVGRIHDATLLISIWMALLGRSPISFLTEGRPETTHSRLGIKVRLE
jgi:hypothetical protein